MDTQKLLNAPPKQPKVVAKVSKINNLVESSEQIERSSAKLRKIFETGAYQRKTQLSVLNRYKKRLDAINKESDKKLEKRRKQKGKSIVPNIKPFAGSLFVPKNDPLKSIAQLAAFNAASKLAKGDVFGMIGPGLALASIIFGPKLLKFGAKSALKSVGIGRGYEDLIKKLSKSKNLTKGEEAALKNFDRYRKAGLSVEEAAQRALVRGGGYSVKTAKEYRNLTRTVEGVGERAAERAAARGVEKTAGRGLLKGVRGGVGLLDVVFAGFDFMSRKSEGQTNLQAGAGAAGGAIGGIAGWEAGAAIGAAIGVAFGGIGAVPGAIIGGLIGSFAGSSLGSGLADMITGADKKNSEGGGLKPFSKSLDKYEKTIDKFKLFALSYNQMSPGPPGPPGGASSPGLMSDIEADVGKSAEQIKSEIMSSGASGIVDPTKDPWCAAYVNAELRRNGIQGSGSAAANSFLKWGVPVDKNNIQPGDVIVGDYGGGSQSHVMFATSTPTNGYVNIIGGNQSHKVSSGAISLSKIDGVRRASSMGQTSTQIPTPPPSSISSAPAPRERFINQYTRYSPSAYGEGAIIPLPISLEQQQQMMQGGGSSPMIIGGPSQQDLLNSFYKRVLLNTV